MNQSPQNLRDAARRLFSLDLLSGFRPARRSDRSVVATVFGEAFFYPLGPQPQAAATDPWDLQSGIYEGDGFHSASVVFWLGKLRMIEPKFPFRQFFDFCFCSNAILCFNLPHPIQTLHNLRDPRCPSRNSMIRQFRFNSADFLKLGVSNAF